MPKLKSNQFPSYRLHKQSGQGIVTLDGRDILLGPHDTAESRAKYDRLVAQWQANGRRLSAPPPAGEGLTVSGVLAEFWIHAQSFYRDRAGKAGGELVNFKYAIAPVRRLYGATPAADFGPLSLQAVQREMVRMGWCRKVVNRQVGRVRQVFKWAESQELTPRGLYHALQTVAPLKRGKSAAPESRPVSPVSEPHVAATLPHLSPQCAAMVRLQLLTGMRPGEVVILRGRDVSTGGKVWVYTPAYHKLDHHEIAREVRIGPEAQKILREFWKADLSAYLFSPADAESGRRAALAMQRKTPASCGNAAGTHRAASPKRAPRDRYTTSTYARAVARACAAAFPPPPELARDKLARADGKRGGRRETDAEWRARLGEAGWARLEEHARSNHWHPNQLRHTAATRLRRQFGIDVAQSILGHRLGSNVTEVYAEVDAAKVEEIVGRVG